jgi:SAM-dependent methyltransferase
LPDAAGRPNVVCPRCLSQERHRLLALYLERYPQLTRGRVLHLAPEIALRRALAGADVVRMDLDSPLAEVHADLTAMPFADAEFDLVLCSHVLEHVQDDAAAMRELRRVLRPGGTLLAMVPLRPGVDETDEDPTVVAPDERRVRFLQADHVRLYGRADFVRRLAAAHFDVLADDFVESYRASERERLGLSPLDTIFVCRRVDVDEATDLTPRVHPAGAMSQSPGSE